MKIPLIFLSAGWGWEAYTSHNETLKATYVILLAIAWATYIICATVKRYSSEGIKHAEAEAHRQRAYNGALTGLGSRKWARLARDEYDRLRACKNDFGPRDADIYAAIDAAAAAKAAVKTNEHLRDQIVAGRKARARAAELTAGPIWKRIARFYGARV